MTAPRRAPDNLPPPEAWHTRAECRPELWRDPDLWFPGAYERAELRDAVEICLTCPVRQDCLDAALEAEGAAARNSRYGVWGGLTPGQRHRLYVNARKAS